MWITMLVHIVVHSQHGDYVRINLPMPLVRAAPDEVLHIQQEGPETS